MGVVEEVVGVAVFDDSAFVHEHDLVGDFAGEAHLVGDDEHGHAALGEAGHEVEHALDQFRVQGAGGLVEEHHLGLHREGAGDRDALLLPAGQVSGPVVGAVGQAHLGEAFVRDPVGFGA
ncbi:hypothetical protein GCM10025870_19490 [Agromyces marinus]|uniref:Uncharacterized protein n=1 Tax=Agromyces marinus TaxID=1389020 RepID=A0ABN6YCQ3_9MICO|nr:hypothetical protein GCM10025870_19490 [Agromyces marinus]